MANNRKNIRSAVKAMLMGETSAGTNVYSSRGTLYWESELPAIAIYSEEESAQLTRLQGQSYQRTLDLRIEVRVKASDAVDDDVDDLLAEIESIINSGPSLSGTVLSTVQTNTSTTVVTDSKDEIGVGTLSFECKYVL